jgi:phage/plasmid-like protein (TIGR03299 family)
VRISDETAIPTPEDIRAAVATQMAYDAAERSTEGAETLARNVVVGMVDRYAFPWWAGSWRPEFGESPFYRHGVPAEVVRRRVFSWDVVERELYEATEYMEFGEEDPADPEGEPVNVHREPMAYQKTTGWKALRRSDTGALLHVVKTSHLVHGFGETLLDGFSAIIGDTLVISSAGTLKGGRVGWVQVETDDLEHASGVVIRPHALFTTSHDQSLQTSCRENATNVVCDNSHRRALGEDVPVWSMRHTSGSVLTPEKIEAARAALGLMIEREADSWQIELDLLTREPVSNFEFEATVAELFPLADAKGEPLEGRSRSIVTNKREQLHSMWRRDPRVQPWSGTAWGVVQAANTWRTHEQTVRNAHRFERQMLNAIDGDTGDAWALSKLDVVKGGGIAELSTRASAMQAEAKIVVGARR